jgi:TonB-dependent SusC/RagA subfamily outer membrane receptor
VDLPVGAVYSSEASRHPTPGCPTLKSALTLSEEETMRNTWSRRRHTTGCVLASLLVASGCRPLSGPPATPAPRPASVSNGVMTRDEGNHTYSRIEELIEARSSGIQVIRRSDGSFSLRIRGVSSPATRNDPLIVIDGTPNADGHAAQALALLNPQDVSKIEVLKDAASTAFYGMRGANGVIVITTRQH